MGELAGTGVDINLLPENEEAHNVADNKKTTGKIFIILVLGEGAKVVAPNDYYFISEDSNGQNYIGGRKNDGTPDFKAPQGGEGS